MLKIILFFIFFGSQLFAFTGVSDDPGRFTTDFPIYVQGDVGFIELALNGAAMLTQDSDFRNLTELALFIAILMASWTAFRTFSLASLGKSTFVGMSGLGLMFSPVTTHIIDARTNINIIGPNYTTVANVPYLIALPASLTSSLSAPLQDLVHVATVPIENGEVAGISALAIGNQDQLKQVMKSLYKGASFQKTTNPTLLAFNLKLRQYIQGCVIVYAPFYQYDVDQALTSPRGDLFQSISPGNLIAISQEPTSAVSEFRDIGLIDANGSATYTCGTLHDKIIADIPLTSTELNKEVGGMLPKGLTLNNMAEGLVASGIVNIGDANGSASAVNAITTVNNYIMNIASADTLAVASMAYGGDGIRISQEITALKSKALMQMEGTGGLNFFVEMLPNSMHFIYAIVLFLGVFVGISALAQPQMAITIYKGYFLSFVSFELIKVSQIIISNMTLYYSSTGAAAKLITLNQNGASLTSLSSSYDYLATMTAMSGTIGTMFILAIPSIIYRGDFFGFMSGAIGTTGGKYLGNAVGTAQDAASIKQGGDAAVDSLRKNEVAMRRLKHMFGQDFEPTIGAADYYNKVQAQMGQVSQGAVAMTNMGSLENQASGAMLIAQKQLSSNAQVGATGKYANAITSGKMAGAQTAGAIDGDKLSFDQSGHHLSKFHDAAMTNTRSSHASNFGSAAGSTSSTFEELRQNAEYSTKSGIASTQKKLSTLDGINNAVALDVSNAEKSAIGQRGDIAAWNSMNSADKGSYEAGMTKQSTKALSTTTTLGANKAVTNQVAKDSGVVSGLEMAGQMMGDSQILSQKSQDDIFKAMKTSTLANKKKSIEDAKKLSETFGDVLTGEGSFEVTGKDGKKQTRKIGFDEMIKNEASQGVAGRMGAAEAFNRTGFDMTAQNANYSAESGARATDAKIKASDGIAKAVASDIVAGGMAGAQSSSTADKFGQLFDKESGKLRDKLAEGGEDAARAIKKALEDFKGVTDAGADQQLRGQKGNAKGYLKNQKDFGNNYAELGAESGVRNSAAQSMGNINAMGGGENGVNSSAALAYETAFGDTKGKAAGVAEARKKFGSYAKSQTTAAIGSVDMAYSAFAGKTKSSKQTKVDEWGVEEVFEQKAMMNSDGSLTKEGMAANITTSHEQTAAMMTVFQAKVDNKMASKNGGLTNKGINIIGYGQSMAVAQQSENYNTASDTNARQSWADQTLERLSQKESLGSKDEAVKELKKSGFITGVDDDGKAVLSDLKTSMKSRIQGEALASAFGGMSGLTLSDGTQVKTKMGKDEEGKYKARVDTDSSETNKVGKRTDTSIPQELADKLAGVTGTDILTTLGELTLGGAVVKKGLDFYNDHNVKNAKAGDTFETNQGQTATADGKGNFTVDEEYTDKKGEKQTRKVRVQEGNLKGVAGNAWSKVRGLAEELSPFSFGSREEETLDKTTNSSQHNNSDTPEDGNKNQSFHDEKSPSKMMSNYSTKSPKLQAFEQSFKGKSMAAASALFGKIENEISDISETVSDFFNDNSQAENTAEKTQIQAQKRNNFFAMKNFQSKKAFAAASTVALGTVAAEASETIGEAMNFIGGVPEILLNPTELGAGSDLPAKAPQKSNIGKFESANMIIPEDLSSHVIKAEESHRGGIMDPTSQINGMMNISNTQRQQMATQQIQGEVYNVNGQVESMKNMILQNLVKNAPNVTNEDVERLKKQVGHMRANQNS